MWRAAQGTPARGPSGPRGGKTRGVRLCLPPLLLQDRALPIRVAGGTVVGEEALRRRRPRAPSQAEAERRRGLDAHEPRRRRRARERAPGGVARVAPSGLTPRPLPAHSPRPSPEAVSGAPAEEGGEGWSRSSNSPPPLSAAGRRNRGARRRRTPDVEGRPGRRPGPRLSPASRAGLLSGWGDRGPRRKGAQRYR